MAISRTCRRRNLTLSYYRVEYVQRGKSHCEIRHYETSHLDHIYRITLNLYFSILPYPSFRSFYSNRSQLTLKEM